MNRCGNYGVRSNSFEIHCLPALHTLPSRAKVLYTHLSLGRCPIRCRQLQSASPVISVRDAVYLAWFFLVFSPSLYPHSQIMYLFNSYAVKTEGDL